MSYVLYTNGVLEKDGFYLPIDETNSDYLEYLTWVGLGNQPEERPASEYMTKLLQEEQLLSQIKVEYQNMLTRLQQIQNAGSIPFTQAGFNQVVQAVKDEALYIERVMKFLRRLLT